MSQKNSIFCAIAALPHSFGQSGFLLLAASFIGFCLLPLSALAAGGAEERHNKQPSLQKAAWRLGSVFGVSLAAQKRSHPEDQGGFGLDPSKALAASGIEEHSEVIEDAELVSSASGRIEPSLGEISGIGLSSKEPGAAFSGLAERALVETAPDKELGEAVPAAARLGAVLGGSPPTEDLPILTDSVRPLSLAEERGSQGAAGAGSPQARGAAARGGEAEGGGSDEDRWGRLDEGLSGKTASSLSEEGGAAPDFLAPGPSSALLPPPAPQETAASPPPAGPAYLEGAEGSSFLDKAIAQEIEDPEFQAIFALLKSALKSESHAQFRWMLKRTLELSSSVRIFALLHAADRKTGSTLLHLLSKARSPYLRQELQRMVQAFSPFQAQTLAFQEARASFIPKELQAPGALNGGSLWSLSSPLILSNEEIALSILASASPAGYGGEDVEAPRLPWEAPLPDPALFPKALQEALLKEGGAPWVLALVFGRSLEGISLEELFKHAPELSAEAESLLRWASLPLGRKDKDMKTPLAIAYEKMIRGEEMQSFKLLLAAESALGMDTSSGFSAKPAPASSIWQKCLAVFKRPLR